MDEQLPSKLVGHGVTLRRLVELYCSTQRHEGLPEFQVFGPYNATTAPKSKVAERAGCYVIYTATGAMKYVGMAKKIGYRSVSHLQPIVQSYSFWKQGSPATYIDLIPVYEIWEPHSLEAFLTVKTADLRDSAD